MMSSSFSTDSWTCCLFVLITRIASTESVRYAGKDMSVAIAEVPTSRGRMAWPEQKNPPRLVRWATGRVIEFNRTTETDLSQQDMADKLGMTQRGYAKVEYGTTPNWDKYLEAMDILELDAYPVAGLARMLVRLAQAEELAQGREMEPKELNVLAKDYLVKT